MKAKRRSRKISLIILTTMLVVSTASVVFANSREANKPVVSVNGTVLTEREVGEYTQRVFPAGMFHGTMSPEKIQKYRKEAIELMIDDELLYQEAEKTGLKAKRKEVNKSEKEVIDRIGSKVEYEAALQSEGLSRKEFRKKLEKKILIEKILEREVQNKAAMTEADVKAYYGENKKTYMRPEARRLSHILIKVDPSATSETWEKSKKRAEEVRQKIVDGADFADVAWDYSEDEYRVKGGDLGLMHKGRLTPELESKVWELKQGELSDVIRTIYGYHIVRVEEIRPPEQLTFEQVKDQIKQNYFDSKSKELKETLLSKARENAKIERYE